MNHQPSVLLAVRDLEVWFNGHRRSGGRRAALRKAVDGVDFDVHAGRTLGLVGESGCGKTTVCRALLRLQPASGHAWYKERDILRLRGGELRQLRREVQMVFQDPMGSLDPRMTVGAAIAEPWAVHFRGSSAERRDMVAALLQRVGLPADAGSRYPHQFSGGQRQRVCIARALILRPELLICDEAVSALDVTVQAQMLDLLQQLQRDLGLSYLFVSHNLAVVSRMCQDVAVMHRGRIVECGPTAEVFTAPSHEQTRRLLEAIPRLRVRR